mmetsp:Transcript_32899/g.83502  ORF Transcript_32899/g.83502 Transcript_32899/m.83502 type:complete len:260 (+) Transcript_32899:347-1126(+)
MTLTVSLAAAASATGRPASRRAARAPTPGRRCPGRWPPRWLPSTCSACRRRSAASPRSTRCASGRPRRAASSRPRPSSWACPTAPKGLRGQSCSSHGSCSFRIIGRGGAGGVSGAGCTCSQTPAVCHALVVGMGPVGLHIQGLLLACSPVCALGVASCLGRCNKRNNVWCVVCVRACGVLHRGSLRARVARAAAACARAWGARGAVWCCCDTSYVWGKGRGLQQCNSPGAECPGGARAERSCLQLSALPHTRGAGFIVW